MNLVARCTLTLACLLASGAAFFFAPFCNAETDTKALIGLHWNELTVGKKTFRNVEVRAITVRTLTILHAEGMASIPLRELSPELQARFNYSPEAENLADAHLALARKNAESRQIEERHRLESRRAQSAAIKFEDLVQQFGSPPELQPVIDLRPRMFELSLGVKDQGFRPSCSVFAVVSALEFQNAELCGTAEKLSEEYLVWATRRTTQRIPATRLSEEPTPTDTDAAQEKDEGFALSEVVAALRAYGIPLQSAMPNTIGKKIEMIPDPSPEVMEQARSRRRVFVHSLPGHDQATRIGNLVHALNAKIPVPIGIRWPHYRTIRGGFLSEQKPILDYAHAVTLVGYTCESGRLEDTVFLFKNSYGTGWGEGGYGRVTFHYLKQYLLDAVLLEVQSASG